MTRRPSRSRRSDDGGKIGHPRYPQAQRLVITADGGGSRLARSIVETRLQSLANELGLTIEVHHLPPGTSKWNKIEHRLFSFISLNWRAKPLISYRVIVELISATTTQSGLRFDANSTPTPMPRESPSPTSKWKPQHPTR